MVHGLFPAVQAIGQQVVNDADHLIFTKGLGMAPRQQSFGLDNLAKSAAQGFVRESPILPLLKADFKEAGHRFYERPISGTFDMIGLGSGAMQGLKYGSKIPGSLGESALRARGYSKFDLSSLGNGTHIGDTPAYIKKADGVSVPAREYMLRPQEAIHDGNLWLRKSMRSAKSSGNKTFDDAVDTAATLGEDPLTLQAIPRAGFEPFARIGDELNKVSTPSTGSKILDWAGEATFGPQLGSRRFGKRLAIRNQSRLKVSVNEMMGVHGLMKKQWEKAFGKDAAPLVGDALMAEAAGLRSGADIIEGLKNFTPSGRKAVLTDKGVDLRATKGNVVELHKHELRQAELAVEKRDLMLNNLADRIEKINGSGHSVVMTGGKNGDRILTPAQVRTAGDELAYKLPSRNLFIKKGVPTKKSNAAGGSPFDQGPAKADPKPAPKPAAPKKSSTFDYDPVHTSDTKTVYEAYDEAVGKLPFSKGSKFNYDLQAEIRAGVPEEKAFQNGLAKVNAEVVRHGKIFEPDNAATNVRHVDTKPADEVAVRAVDEPDVRVGELEPRRGTPDEISAAREEVFGPDKTDPFAGDKPFDDEPPVPPVADELGDSAPDGWAKKLRTQTAEDYSQMVWHKNYLDQLVKARVSEGPDIVGRFHEIASNPRVIKILESDTFRNEILPKHKATLAAQLEADKVKLGANALSNENVVRNTDRLATLFGKEGEGSFFVARPKYGKKKAAKDRVRGDQDIEIIDENLPGDPQELIARGELNSSPDVHLSNYLASRNESAKQELFDSVKDAAVAVDPQQTKVYVQEGVAMTEESWKKGTSYADHVIIEPNGDLYDKIESMQPLANQAARRLAEDGHHAEASNVAGAAKEMWEATKEGDFSLGDMIRDPKLRGEFDNTRYMIPRDMYEAIRAETSNATNALSSFLQYTSTGFKISVLHGRWPAWVLNNTIGAQLYLALTGGTGRMIPHAGSGTMVREVFPDVLGVGSREMAVGADDLGRVAKGRLDKLLQTKPGRISRDVINAMGDANQKIADEPARLARLEQVVEERFQSTVQLARARGRDIPDTLESRRRMLMDQTVREDIAAEVLDDMIDFTTLSKSERMWASNLIPFWTFVKGSTKSSYRTLADHPGRVWPIQELGSFGSEVTDESYKNGTPEYLRALLPMGNGQALSIGGWNPYGQQGSLFSLATQLASGDVPTGQDHPFSMVNPALTIPLEAINKRDTYTQYPIQGNVAQIVGRGVLSNIPLLESLKNMTLGKEVTGREVFPASRRNSILNFAGLPVRNVNERNMAVRLKADENRNKKNGIREYWQFHDGV